MKSKSAVLAICAVLVAYPWALIVVPLIAVGMIRNFTGMCLLLITFVAVVIAMYIMFPVVPRTIAALQRFWARKVFEIWKLIEMKQTIAHSEKRMRETVVSESRPVQDLGGDLDAA